MHGSRVFMLAFILSMFSHFSQGQNSTININAIPDFIRVLEDNKDPFQIQSTSLSDLRIDVHWMVKDRRFVNCFIDRLSYYISNQNIDVKYYISDRTIEPNGHHLSICVIDGQNQPGRLHANAMVIDLSKENRSIESPPAYFQFNPQSVNCTTFDLLAQYIFKGIKLNKQHRLATDERLSFLPASYYGLDEEWINSRLDSILELGVDSMAFPGAQLAITYKGSVIYQRNIGYHTYDNKLLVRKDDIYDLASLTKVVAGVSALMTLHEENLFDIHATLESYFPDFSKSPKGDLNFERILSHSAGLKPYLVYYQLAEKKNHKYYRNTFANHSSKKYPYPITQNLYLSDNFLNFIKKSILDSPLDLPGNYVYSGLSFLLYPELVHNQTGQSIDQFLKQNLYDPLGASRILYNPSSDLHLNQIIPTEVDQEWRHRLVHGQVHDEAAAVLQGVSTNAGLFANAIDLTKLAESWRRGGHYGGKSYWQDSTIQLFTSCVYCDEGNRRALGFDRPPLPDTHYNSYMSPLASQTSFGHSGFTGTMLWVDPSYEYSFVFLSNRVYPTRENRKIYSLNIRSELHSILYQAINNRRP